MPGVNLMLHGSGAVVSGMARAGQTTSLNGSYAFRTSGSPTPTGAVGVLTFDGAGNGTLSGTAVGAPGAGIQLPVSTVAFTGTYSINPDGSGTLNFTAETASWQEAGSPAPRVPYHCGAGPPAADSRSISDSAQPHGLHR